MIFIVYDLSVILDKLVDLAKAARQIVKSVFLDRSLLLKLSRKDSQHFSTVINILTLNDFVRPKNQTVTFYSTWPTGNWSN